MSVFNFKIKKLIIYCHWINVQMSHQTFVDKIVTKLNKHPKLKQNPEWLTLVKQSISDCQKHSNPQSQYIANLTNRNQAKIQLGDTDTETKITKHLKLEYTQLITSQGQELTLSETKSPPTPPQPLASPINKKEEKATSKKEKPTSKKEKATSKKESSEKEARRKRNIDLFGSSDEDDVDFSDFC